MKQFRKQLGLIICAMMLVVASVMTTRATEVIAPPIDQDVRSDVLGWVATQDVSDPATVQQVGVLWNDGKSVTTPRRNFENVIKTFALVNGDAKQFVDACELVDVPLLPPEAKLLEDDLQTPFFSQNMRLYYGRYLTQIRMYDEALEVFAKTDVEKVVDPATLLFHKAVCEQQLLMKKEGLATIKRLLLNTEHVPTSYQRLAKLMQYELENLKDGSLGQVARLMSDVERRLELARGGEKVQQKEEEVVVLLDEIIERIENSGGGGGGGGGGSGGQDGKGDKNSSSPASDSKILAGTGPGQTDDKTLKKENGWGSLPPKEAARAKNIINRNFPPRYRNQLDEYFKKLAERPAEGGR